MTSRILPSEEWAKLAHTDLGPYVGMFTPGQVQVMVVEDHDHIIGCLALLRMFHAEGLWIDPVHRARTAALRHLLKLMRKMAGKHEVKTLVAGALTDQMRQILAGLDAERLPDQYVIPMRKADGCPL